MLDLQKQVDTLKKEAIEELNHIDRCFRICRRNNGKCFSDVNHISAYLIWLSIKAGQH